MKTEIKLITPEMAKRMLESQKTNRRINYNTMSFYSSQMKKNQWKLTGQGISFDKNGNLIDGQHRLSAIIHSNKTIEMLVITDLDNSTFEVYDTGKKRNPSDVLFINKIKNDRAIASGIGFYFSIKKKYYGERGSSVEMRISNTDILDKYYEYPDKWQYIFNFCQRLYSKLRLYKLSQMMGVYAYLDLDLNYNFVEIEDFFNQLFDQKITSYGAIKKLREVIFKTEMGRYKLNHRHKLALLIKTWNFYTSNKDVKKLIWSEENEKFPNFI